MSSVVVGFVSRRPLWSDSCFSAAADSRLFASLTPSLNEKYPARPQAATQSRKTQKPIPTQRSARRHGGRFEPVRFGRDDGGRPLSRRGREIVGSLSPERPAR